MQVPKIPNNKNNTPIIKSGPGFFSILALIFITLKLLDITVVASWSWWWVLAPIWAPIAILAGALLVAFIIAMVLSMFIRD